MPSRPIDTPLALSGPFRAPEQMLETQEYCLQRQIVAFGQTHRPEGYWVKTLVRDCDTDDVLA